MQIQASYESDIFGTEPCLLTVSYSGFTIGTNRNEGRRKNIFIEYSLWPKTIQNRYHFDLPPPPVSDALSPLLYFSFVFLRGSAGEQPSLA